MNRLRDEFPYANVTGRNGALSATPPMDLCLDKFVEPDVDLVFIEYCANDGAPTGSIEHDTLVQSGYERLIRRILSLPGRPAVVLLQAMAMGLMFAPASPGKLGFLDTCEDMYGGLAQCDLTWLSM